MRRRIKLLRVRWKLSGIVFPMTIIMALALCAPFPKSAAASPDVEEDEALTGVVWIPNVVVATEDELRAEIEGTVENSAKIIALSGDISLTGGQIVIPATKIIWLTGDGEDFRTIDAQNRSRVVFVETGGILCLRNIRLTGGNTGAAGGGVNNAGTLVLKNAEIVGNITKTNGGGIFNIGDVTMEGGAISCNEAIGETPGAGYGGAVYNGGTFTMKGGEMRGNRSGKAEDAFGRRAVHNAAGSVLELEGVVVLNNGDAKNS